MTTQAHSVIPLTEYVFKELSSDALTDQVGQLLLRDYGSFFDMDYPSPKTDNQWRLKSNGFVGYIPLTEQLAIRIEPRVSVASIFRMWEIAHHVPLHWFTGAQAVQSIEEVYSEIAGHLATSFLEVAGPTQIHGDQSIRPFLINMPMLFERFVAEILKVHIAPECMVDRKPTYTLATRVRFQPDVVIRDRATGKAVCVLDTKYKESETPESSDVEQVVAYAEYLDCQDAVLVYPFDLDAPLEIAVGRIRVRSLSLPLDGNYREATLELLRKLAVGMDVDAASMAVA